MLVVINADNLGLHPAVQRATEKLAADGIVTSATLLPNAPFVREAAALPGIGLGIHLNVILGKPLGTELETSSLTDEHGYFLGSPGALFRRYLSNRIDYIQLEREWRRQIEFILSLGVTPTHFASERHIHALPAFMNIAMRLASEYCVPWVRRPLEHTPVGRMDRDARQAKFLKACCLLHRRGNDVGWPDMVWGIADSQGELSPEGFRQYLEARPKARVVEICVSPGLPEKSDPPIPQGFQWPGQIQNWKSVFEQMADPAWLEAINGTNATLVHYGEIDPATKTLFK